MFLGVNFLDKVCLEFDALSQFSSNLKTPCHLLLLNQKRFALSFVYFYKINQAKACFCGCKMVQGESCGTLISFKKQ